MSIAASSKWAVNRYKHCSILVRWSTFQLLDLLYITWRNAWAEISQTRQVLKQLQSFYFDCCPSTWITTTARDFWKLWAWARHHHWAEIFILDSRKIIWTRTANSFVRSYRNLTSTGPKCHLSKYHPYAQIALTSYPSVNKGNDRFHI